MRVASRPAGASPRAFAGYWTPALLLLTLAAFGLRVAGFDQSLFGDELFTFVVVRDGFGGIWDGLQHFERNPPLYFLLAWLTGKLGEPTVWVRLPSLLFGTATVPVLYLLGARTVGRTAALVAAALMALSPFAIFYSDEARAYATLVFLVSLSTLSLLVALERRQLRWWALFALASCGALYAHYTAIFVIVAQAAWAAWFHRDRARELLMAHAAIALAYLPWIPSLLGQENSVIPGRPWSLLTLLKMAARVLPGHPLVAVRDLPGRPLLVAFCLGLMLAAAGSAIALVRRRQAGRSPATPPELVWLLLALVAAAPLGLAVSDAFGTSLLFPRNLASSLPAACLLIGALLVGLPRPLSLAAAVLVLGSVLGGTIQGLGSEGSRPDFKAAARLLDAQARPGDPVVQVFLAPPSNPPSRALLYQFKRPHRIFVFAANDREGWRLAEARGRLFIVAPYLGPFRHMFTRPPPGLERCFVLRSRRIYAGLSDIAVYRYARTNGCPARRA